MKARTIIVAAVCGTALLLTSCKGCGSKKDATGGKTTAIPEAAHRADNINVRDSLNLSHDAGEVVSEMFAGQIPGADVPGINYELTLTHYSMMNNGVYRLKSTYVDGDGAGKDATFYTYGRYNTFIGIPGEELASYIRLVPFEPWDSGQSFAIEDNGSLTMLAQDNSRIKSEFNYTLRKG